VVRPQRRVVALGRTDAFQRARHTHSRAGSAHQRALRHGPVVILGVPNQAEFQFVRDEAARSFDVGKLPPTCLPRCPIATWLPSSVTRPVTLVGQGVRSDRDGPLNLSARGGGSPSPPERPGGPMSGERACVWLIVSRCTPCGRREQRRIRSARMLTGRDRCGALRRGVAGDFDHRCRSARGASICELRGSDGDRSRLAGRHRWQASDVPGGRPATSLVAGQRRSPRPSPNSALTLDRGGSTTCQRY
jgi:hypothetical protein